MAQRMVRKQVYIMQEQEERLKRLAERRGCSEAELVRRGVEEALAEEEKRLSEAETAWDEEMRFLRRLSDEAQQLRKQGVTGGRTGTRGDLYEDRFERHGR
jgi:hypothetical protein